MLTGGSRKAAQGFHVALPALSALIGRSAATISTEAAVDVAQANLRTHDIDLDGYRFEVSRERTTVTVRCSPTDPNYLGGVFVYTLDAATGDIIEAKVYQ